MRRTPVPDDWQDLRETVTLPPGALDAARALRYGEPTDTYTWDYVAEAALLAAAPLIRAAERDRIRQLADRNGAVCTGDEGTSCYFSELIREPSDA
jgi:hypothetical protein